MGNFVDYGIRVDVLLRTKMVQDAQGNFNTNDVPGDMVPPALIAADKRNGVVREFSFLYSQQVTEALAAERWVLEYP